MSDTPEELYYAPTHEWLRREEDGIATVGITDFAQDELGDVVFVELPEGGIQVNAGDEVSVVESVKTASDINTPASGEIIEVNTALLDNPELINTSPYQDGWIFRLRLATEADLDTLLSAEEYKAANE